MKKKSKWWILFITTSATSLVFLDNTIIPVALPTIQKSLGFSSVGLLWIVNTYLLVLASLMMVGGRLYDIIGKRRTYLWGLTLFGLGSLLGGISSVQWGLLLGRGIQGVGGALIVPTTGAILIESFPQGERGKAIGFNTGISSFFLLIGPAIGGLLTQYLNWRYIFFVNVPIVIYGFIMAHLYLPKEEMKKGSFHFVGAMFFTLSMVALVVGLMEGGEKGWSSLVPLSSFLLFILFFVTFLVSSKKSADPFIDMSLFKLKNYRAAILVIFFSQLVVMVSVLWAIYFQEQWKYTPTQTGLLILLATSPVIFMAPLSGYLTDRFGPKLPISIGFILLFLCLSWFGMNDSQGPSAYLLVPALLPFGCGIPLIMAASMTLALSSAQEKQLGQASSLTTTVRQVSATMGVALMTAFYQTAQVYFKSITLGFIAVCFLGAFFALVGLVITLKTVGSLQKG